MAWEFGVIMMPSYKYYHFWGFTSQLIIVIPEKNMVVVRTGKLTTKPKTIKAVLYKLRF
jgi:hypothetical protein